MAGAPPRAGTSLDFYLGSRPRWVQRFRLRRAKRRAARSGLIHLTYDDGPDPERTPAVLEALAAERAPATFFVVAAQAAEHPELIGAMLEAGHRVELHCMHHVAHGFVEREQTERETEEALGILRELGTRPRLWRPPFGIVQPWTPELARSHGLRLCGWSVDPEDWRGDRAEAMFERAEPRIAGGGVVLCHDGAAVSDGARADAASTAGLTRMICAEGRKRGLDPALLDRGVPIGRLMVASHGAEGRAADLAVRPVDEDAIPETDLDQVKALLASVIERHADEYSERGYRRVRPEFRVLAYSGGEVLGTCSMMVIGSRHPECLVYGIGDLVVAPEVRGGGLARRMLHLGFNEARHRGADVAIGDTTAVATTLGGMGFERVPRFRYVHERDGACHWGPQWWAWEREPLRERLWLEEGDF